MAENIKENYLSSIAKLITEAATRIFREETSRYQQEQGISSIDPEILTLVKERAISEVMFHSGDFHPKMDLKDYELKDTFDQWFKEDCAEDIRRMCIFNLKSELQRRTSKEDSATGFLERFKKGDVQEIKYR